MLDPSHRWKGRAKRRLIAYSFLITKGKLIKDVRFLPIAVLVAVVLTAGCGGSGNADEQPFTVQAVTTVDAGKLPKPQFVTRINKICREAWVIILDNFAKYSGWHKSEGSEEQVFARSVRLSLMPGIDFHIFDDILWVGAPKGEQVDIEEIVGPMQEAVERGERLGPLYSVKEIVELFDSYNERADRYGLVDCLVDERHLGPIEA